MSVSSECGKIFSWQLRSTWKLKGFSVKGILDLKPGSKIIDITNVMLVKYYEKNFH